MKIGIDDAKELVVMVVSGADYDMGKFLVEETSEDWDSASDLLDEIARDVVAFLKGCDNG